MMMHMTALLAVASLLLNVAIAEVPDISKINVNDLQQQLPAEFANVNFTLDDAKALLRDKCIEVAGGQTEVGTNAFKEVEVGTATFAECVTGLVNTTALQIEIEEAKPHGELDTVFNKYCLKRPAALACIKTFNAKVMVCLDDDERKNQEVFMHIVESLLNFICHKGGDQIALFIAEKGPECLSSKKDEIQQCLNDTLSGYLPKEGGLESIKTTKLPKFVMGPQQCTELQTIEKCIVQHLEKCSDITPANIVESMFRFIRNETICRNTGSAIAAKQSVTNSSSHEHFNSTFMTTLLLSVTCVVTHLLGKRLAL